LEAARDLIWKHGFFAVTIDTICVEAGVRKGSLYHFFDDKSDLATAAFGNLWESIRPRLEQAFSPEAAPLERLRNYFRFRYEYQAGLRQKYGRVMGCPFCLLGLELSDRPEPVAAIARPVLDSRCDYIEAALRDFQADGRFHITDAAISAQRVSVFVEGCLLQARIQNNFDLLNDLASGGLAMIGARENGAELAA
jgi:TetR/AcrR family transcriptional repressor of nem operon